jgi:hypothetical protein
MKHVKKFEQISKSIRFGTDINIIDELNQGQTKPISINDIDDWFYGVSDVIYGYDRNKTSFFVSIYTQNRGENINNLVTIKKYLKADDITISIVPTIKTETNGIIYILWYKTIK